MRRLIASAALAAALHPAIALAWTDELPEGWLVVVSVREPLQIVEQATQVMPAGVMPASVGAIATKLISIFEVDNRSLAVGVAKADSGSYEPFALLPIEDYESLLDRLDADRGVKEAFANLFGYELRLQPTDGYTWLALASSTLRPATSGQPCVIGPDATLSVNFSHAGLAESHRLSAKRRDARIATGKPPRYAWSNSKEVLNSIGELSPIIEKLAEHANQACLSLEISEGGVLNLRLITNTNDAVLEEFEPPHASPSAALTDEQLASFSMRGATPEVAIDLMVAAISCRADTVGAREYNPRALKQFGETLANFTGCLDAFAAEWRSPTAELPLTANRTLAFRSATDLSQPMTRIIDKWNLLITATPCETPLRVYRTPLEKADGIRLTTDVSAALGEELAEPIMPMLERVFGPSGELTEDFVRLGDNHWRLAAPGATSSDEPFQVDSSSDWSLVGAARIDRWLKWQRDIESVFAGEVLGKKPLAEITECPSIQFSAMTDQDGTLVIELASSITTLQTALMLSTH